MLPTTKREELIHAISLHTDVPPSDVAQVLDALLAFAVESLKEGKTFVLKDFGRFRAWEKTKAGVKSKTVRFKAAKFFKDVLNERID